MLPEILHYTPHAVVGTLLTVLGWFVKNKVQEIVDDFKIAQERLATIESIARNQAENHLKTIQTEAIKQTALLEEMLKAQAETNGFLKAVCDLGRK
jgi:hypothetical protein